MVPSRTDQSAMCSCQSKPDYKALHGDVERELQRVQKEGEEHTRMLSQEAAKAREAASAARSEAARMRNEAEFERDRSQRLQDQLRDLHQQLEVLTQSNSKYQVRAAVEHQMVADVLHLFSYATCTSLFLSAIVGAHQRDAAAPGQSGLSAEQRKGSGSTT